MKAPLRQYYYIIFQNAEGSFPQRDSCSYNKKEVEKEIAKLNEQLKQDGKYPWCCYSLGTGNEFTIGKHYSY